MTGHKSLCTDVCTDPHLLNSNFGLKMFAKTCSALCNQSSERPQSSTPKYKNHLKLPDQREGSCGFIGEKLNFTEPQILLLISSCTKI